VQAEAAAKCVLLQGSARAQAWLSARSSLAALWMTDDGRVHTQNFDRWLWP
jgi:hypothetical protein